jgi:CRISPR-associated endonuclease/helicase Cas3
MDKTTLDDHAAWGKLELSQTAGHLLKWHPLIDHMADVAACFWELAHCRGIRRALEHAARGPLAEVDLRRLCVLVFLHDLGKANAGFQAKRWGAPEKPVWWPNYAGHSSEALLAFDVPSLGVQQSLHVEALLSWGDGVYGLLRASISHHGRPVQENALADPRIWQPVVRSDGTHCYNPAATILDIGRRVRAMYPEAFVDDLRPLPATPAFAHLFAGLVQLADWLGSDTRFFDYSEPGEDRIATARERARTAVAAINLDVDDLRRRLLASTPTFSHVFEVAEPRAIQTATASPELDQLVILESETGSGKTEAALWRFAQLFKVGVVDGLYFALPTRVAATQLYSRLLRFAHKLWPLDAPAVIRALPGYEAADGSTRERLPDFSVLWADDPIDREADKRWAAESPKRYLAATLAVGTVDQALLGALRVRHAHLRHALLSRSLLVVDEVHASDAYMGLLLEKLLAAHLNLGGHALLLSATLGATARARYQALVRIRDGTQTPCLGLIDACRVPYPALSDGAHVRALQSASPHKLVTWRALDAIDEPDHVAALALAAAAEGARVLVIRNTVPAAVATLVALETLANGTEAEHCLFSVRGASTLHHSRFSREDRPLLDAEVEAQIGKRRTQPGGRVVIGTQTLEQSLDLDADLLITDLCPMDVLLQRVGRLHRHVRPDSERPEAYRHAQAYVLMPKDGDLTPMLDRARHGLGMMRMRNGERGGVYPDLRIIEATRRLVCTQQECSIPRDNRFLVERATHPDALLDIETEMGAAWRALGQEIDGITGAKRAIGRLQTLPFDEPFDDDLKFPVDERIATRLGAADRLAEFDPPVMGPFGQQIRRLPIRHHMLPSDLDADAQPTVVAARNGYIEFTLGSADYRYHRFGLERINGVTTVT